MPIVVNIDVMMARRKMSAGELAERVGITPANLSILKNNKAKAIRFSTLEALCKAGLQAGGHFRLHGGLTKWNRRKRRRACRARLVKVRRFQGP